MTWRGLILVMTLGGALGTIAPRSTWGDDRQYVLIFGAQPTPKRIKYSHTWATFVRVIQDDADPSHAQLFAHTISFYPADLEVRPFALTTEPGVNLDLPTTLALMRHNQASTTVWGPFLMRPEVYQRSLEVWSLTASGAVEYRAIDTIRNQFIADCIHSVTAVDPDYGRAHYPLIRVGKAASRYIAHQIVKRTDPERIKPDQTWLIAALGLDQHPIEVILPSQIPQRRGIWCLGRD